MIKPDVWQNCYIEMWKGFIVDEAFCHPAKFSHALIGKIYDHALKMGWVKKGDYILDPFAGVALGALHSLINGLNWIGVELEQKFVDMGGYFECPGVTKKEWIRFFAKGRQGKVNYKHGIHWCPVCNPKYKGDGKIPFSEPHHYSGNIDLWTHKFREWPHLGMARIIQGDSRCIKEVVKEAGLIVSSPPYLKKIPFQDKTYIHVDYRPERKGTKWEKVIMGDTHSGQDYGHTPGNLANMKEGKFEAVISSSPYPHQVHIGGIDKEKLTGNRAGKYTQANSEVYGQSPGQLGSMKEGEFSAIVSSPNFPEQNHSTGWSKKYQKEFIRKLNIKYPKRIGKLNQFQKKEYFAMPESPTNLGNISGDTFWQASKEIVQGCYDLLKPGGHAIWVTKDYIKKGVRVPFSDRWAALCESVGFKLVCWHHASLVQKHGTQGRMFEGDEEISIERKSFFRRLAEKKGSPRIDYESVICMVKERKFPDPKQEELEILRGK
jgi:hypothetical protein